MYCPNCGSESDDGTQKCSICGCPLIENDEVTPSDSDNNSTVCPVCGEILDDTDSVCPLCGTKIESKESTPQPLPTPEPPERLTEDNKDKVSQKPAKTWGITIAIIVVALISLIFIFQGYLFPSQKEADKMTESLTPEETTPKETESSTENESIKKEKETEEKKETDSETEANESTEKAEISLNVNTYLGYWNIAGNQDRELTIQNMDRDMVTFSLWYNSLDALYDVTAILEGNTAQFAKQADGAKIKGILTFNDNSISIEITESERTYMPVESMEFGERHLQSWENRNDSLDTYNTPDYYDYTNVYDSNYMDYYILPDSAWRLLTIDDIYGLTLDQLALARNEIYARHGRKFSDPYFKDYFESQIWYQGTIEPENFNTDVLSDIEKANIEFIKVHE